MPFTSQQQQRHSSQTMKTHQDIVESGQLSVTLPAFGQVNHRPFRWSSFKTKSRTSQRHEEMARRKECCLHDDDNNINNNIEEPVVTNLPLTDSHSMKLELSSRLIPQIEARRDRRRTSSRATITSTTQRLFNGLRPSSISSSFSLISLAPHLIFLIGIIIVTSQTSADILNQTTQPSDQYFNSKQSNQSPPQMLINQQQHQLNPLVSNTNSSQMHSSQPSSSFLNRTPLMKQAPLHRLGNQQRDHLNYKTTYACEGNQMELNCQEGKLIHLVRANYGRFSLSICNELGHSNYSVQCASFRAFLFMETRCNKLSNCTVTVSEELFGDPCKGTSKYLEVQYYCDDVNNQNTSGANNRQTQPGTTNNLLISDLNNKASVPAAPSVSHKSPSLPNGVGVQQAPTAVPSLSDGGTSSSNSNNNDNVVLGPDQTTTTTTTMTRTSGNNFGENYLGQQQQQQQQQQQASVIQQQQQHRFCPPQFSSRNLVWNMTRAGQVTRQACPEGSTGRVSWLCDYERLRFQPLLAPDFSECRSNWLTRLSQQLDQMLELPSSMKQQQQSMLSSETLRHQDEQMIKSVLGELSLMARTKELFSEDLKRIDIMIGQMIAQLKSMSVLFGSSQHLQQQPAVASTLPNNRLVSMYEDLFVKLTNVISSLFDMSQRNAWFELPSFEIRRRLELRLLNHLRDAALMMAQSLPIEQLAEMPPVRQTNILAGISVIPNADSSSQSNRVGVPLDGTTGELNLASSKQQSLLSSSAYGSQLNRLFATTTTTSSSTADSADDQQAELRLQATLLKELAANGINKFVILDIKKPDYSLMRQQLEQQQQAAYSSSLQQNELIGGGGAQQSGSLDSSQNLAGDLAQYQSRIFGIFPTIGDTGEYFDVSHQHQATTTAVDSGSKPELRRLAEMLIQSPLSVEFKLAPTNGAVANSYNNNQPMRQCQSLSSDISAPTDPQLTTTTAIAPRCHLSKFNSTNFVCLCDTFGFVSLTQQLVQPNPSLQSGFQLLQNDRFQWPNSVPGSSSYDSNNQIDPQLDPRLYDQTAYVVNKQQQLQQQQQPQTYFGILTSIFVVIGLGLLIVSIGGLVVSLGIRLTSQARLSKKQKQSFFESLNGPTTGPLTDHNLLGSDPLVSSAATTHSASIIGLNTGASGQTCSTTTTTAAAAGANIQGTGVSDYKAHQQFYAHHPHTSPMLDAYGPSTLTTGQASGRWPARLAGWLLRRPTSWLSNQLSSNAHRNHHHHQHQVDGPLCGKAVDQMIQHRLIGGTGSTTLLNQHANGSMLAYHHQQHHHKSPYQNGYTTSLGLQHQIQHQHHHHHHQTRGQISSTGSHSGVPLNSSSNSSYVSSSAYYEEIGPGNLTKMNPSRPTTAAPASGNLVDSFKRHPHNQDPGHQQLALMANTNQAGTANNQHLHQQHLHHQHMQQQQQQQYPHNQWQPVGGNGMISYHQTEAHTALAQSVQQVQANQKQQQQPQQVSMITKQHLHNDLSPLQSSSSSSAGSQHSASLATNVTTATGNASSGNGATTPRHYLFASPSAVTAYKQQQQNFRG